MVLPLLIGIGIGLFALKAVADSRRGEEVRRRELAFLPPETLSPEQKLEDIKLEAGWGYPASEEEAKGEVPMPSY